MVDYLCESIGRYHSWAYATSFSDHKVEVLEIALDINPTYYPFKFNLVWLADDKFCNLVKDIWSNLEVEVGLSQLCRLVKKLFILKIMVRKWEKGRKESQAKEISIIEEEYHRISNVMDEDLFSAERKKRLLLLDEKSRKLLKVQEETMRKKSREVWLENGDNN